MKLKRKLVGRIMSLGLSGFIMAVTNSLVQIVCNITIGAYGGDLYIGVMTILNSVREIANIAIVGITNGAQPVLGFNYGAGKTGNPIYRDYWLCLYDFCVGMCHDLSEHFYQNVQ